MSKHPHNEAFMLPDGHFTTNAADAAEQWADAFYQAKDALARLRPIPERILRKEPVVNLGEALAEADTVLKLGDKLL